MTMFRRLFVALSLTALALPALAACDRPDEPGETMDEQEFPDQNRETDGEPFDDQPFGRHDRPSDTVEPDTRQLRDQELAPSNAPQGLAPGAPGIGAGTAPERLPGEQGAER